MRRQLFNWNLYGLICWDQVRKRTSISPTYLTVWKKGIVIPLGHVDIE